MNPGPKPSDLTGRRFGRLVVMREAERRGRHRYWLALCDCGASKEIRHGGLTVAGTISCGCAQREAAAMVGAATATHGRYGTPTYRIWNTMRLRCTKPSQDSFKYYGGRGIKVCDRWASFENFLTDMGERPPGMTIDRINPAGDYEPENCRWATWREQRLNQQRMQS